MQRLPPDGVQLHYVDEGAGPPLLFVHGTPTWSFEWRHLIAGLRDSYRCIAPDHLGFGKSPRPADAEYSPAAHADRLRQFVTRLGLDDVTLVVHDFGGLIGLPLAIDPPRIVRRLVVINSWMWHLGEDPALARGARLLGGRLGRFVYERLNFSLRVIMPAPSPIGSDSPPKSIAATWNHSPTREAGVWSSGRSRGPCAGRRRTPTACGMPAPPCAPSPP
jgi:pimeloyl-ACP methyl ester carboxylesterase